MIDQLVKWDTDLFLFLNGIHNSFWDQIMFYISEKWVWIPLYILIIGVLIKLFKRNAIWVILTIIAVVGLNDFISVNLFKNVIMRLRPCHNPSLEGLVHIVNNHCGGQFGFYSSHASNHFGIATIVSLFLYKRINRYWIVGLFIWATIIAYSRIYLGVHYPGDVIAGALAGTLLAYGLFRLLLILKPDLA